MKRSTDSSQTTYYALFEVSSDCSFAELKKAYFAKAKGCHPDRHGGSRKKEEQFKSLVHAFDILSDPGKRASYDISIGLCAHEPAFKSTREYSVMDTPADDTLEEIIVGNDPPKDTTLATLFLDLERTEVFMLFREGKNHYYQGRYGKAMSCFRRSSEITPYNILYRFYLARVCAAAGRFGESTRHYIKALELGRSRVPPQRLERVRAELETVRKKRNPWWNGLVSLFKAEEPGRLFNDPSGDMVDEANRAIEGIMSRRERERQRERKRLEAGGDVRQG
ncbi:MAG: DnaJ domain-containing protein [Victivallales bacterium]|nr:DnaJ domain-containing protein [Victivallales bacterium]